MNFSTHKRYIIRHLWATALLFFSCMSLSNSQNKDDINNKIRTFIQRDITNPSKKHWKYQVTHAQSVEFMEVDITKDETENSMVSTTYLSHNPQNSDIMLGDWRTDNPFILFARVLKTLNLSTLTFIEVKHSVNFIDFVHPSELHPTLPAEIADIFRHKYHSHADKNLRKLPMPSAGDTSYFLWSDRHGLADCGTHKNQDFLSEYTPAYLETLSLPPTKKGIHSAIQTPLVYCLLPFTYLVNNDANISRNDMIKANKEILYTHITMFRNNLNNPYSIKYHKSDYLMDTPVFNIINIGENKKLYVSPTNKELVIFSIEGIERFRWNDVEKVYRQVFAESIPKHLLIPEGVLQLESANEEIRLEDDTKSLTTKGECRYAVKKHSILNRKDWKKFLLSKHPDTRMRSKKLSQEEIDELDHDLNILTSCTNEAKEALITQQQFFENVWHDIEYLEEKFLPTSSEMKFSDEFLVKLRQYRILHLKPDDV